MVKVLVFDTETTGLPPFQVTEKDYPYKKGETSFKYNARMRPIRDAKRGEERALDENPSLWENYTETWPYIVQLSYIMFDMDTNETIERDIYVNMPPQFTTEEYLSTAHHITETAIRAGLASNRVNVEEALEEFMTFFRDATVVTGHNVNFDINMLLAECARHSKPEILNEIVAAKSANKIYCTACKSTNLVKIYQSYNRNKNPPVFKTPKLNEAYFRMFGYAPNESALHNALIDVVACLRVFYRLWVQGIQFTPNSNDVPVCGVGAPDIYLILKDMSPINPIVRIINEFTPAGVDASGVGSPGLTICQPIDAAVLTDEMVNGNGSSQNGGKKTKRRRPRKSRKSKKSRKSRKSRRTRK
jgi:DNA polymerase III epsilon subunit-like protein